ncbi:hypothetical protein [Amycolatopsis sp. WQ 127309]|uniref:hypothetical protein n=1 Tax=Amycolatopsis sp. WQ 127309 TaxID=2932773 RepID=UPI001FF42BEA|nr:hypothetical protein [Amycolatopsis sp. WQ 127309]UOZ09375.1 hypothetical protein MUY22_14330 [Amycolatopsis sp. WQ 127309]
MVDTTSPARDVHTVAYTPAQLNRLISREIAGRLHEVSETLLTNVAFLMANDAVPAAAKQVRTRTYLDVVAQLWLLAAGELDSVTGEQVTR